MVSRHSGFEESGYKLMMAALDGEPRKAKIQLTPLNEVSEVDEQKGLRSVFTGSVWAIRNAQGHEHSVKDDIDTCLM